MTVSLDGLPGAELVRRGLADLRAGRARTVEALLVAAAPELLEELGIDYPRGASGAIDEPEIALYKLLCESEPDPYSAYNALRRRFDRFVRALTARRAQSAAQ